jgi:hypothetical protein
MKHFRISLAQSMAVVLFAAFCFAALRNANNIWASAAYTLAFVTVCVAPIGALARTGTARLAWAGFAVFGWSRFVVGGLPLAASSGLFGHNNRPGLLSELCFDYAIRVMNLSNLNESHLQIFASLDTILYGLVGAIVGSLMAAKTERPNP